MKEEEDHRFVLYNITLLSRDKIVCSTVGRIERRFTADIKAPQKKEDMFDDIVCAAHLYNLIFIISIVRYRMVQKIYDNLKRECR